MRLIISGGRNYRLTPNDLAKLDAIADVTEVVSGACRNQRYGCVDEDGEAWARARGIPATLFHANWDEHGRAAGPIRNRQMAEYADAAALFQGGRGTDNMHAEAIRAGLMVFDYRTTTDIGPQRGPATLGQVQSQSRQA